MQSLAPACRYLLAAAATLVASVAFAAPFAYVPLTGEDSVAVVDLATNTLVAKLPTGASPVGVAVSPAGHRVYVTNIDDGTVTVIDALNNQVLATIAVPSTPVGVAVSPDGRRVAVASLGADEANPNRTVSIIDVANNQVTPVAVGASPVSVVYNSSGSRLYVANFLSGSISVVDAPNLRTVGTIATPPHPFSITLNRSGSTLYTGHLSDVFGGASQVAVTDTASGRVVATIPLDADPEWMALNPAGTRLFVSKPSMSSVSVIDTSTNRVLFDFIAGSFAHPVSVAVSADGSRIYLVDAGRRELSTYDSGTFQRLSSVVIGLSPTAFGNFVGPQNPSSGADSPGPLSGIWWNPSESGWGINFTQRGNNIFAAWYTYDGAGNPKWYVAPNCAMPAGSSSCSGTLYEVSGPQFFGVPYDPSRRNITQVGSLSVSFFNNNAGSMSFSLAGVSRSVAIQRQVFSTEPPPQVDHTDLWWNPNEPGWGLAITQQGSTAFLAWYVYDNSGRPVWYVTPNCQMNATGDSCAGDVFRTTGPAFGPTFDPSQVQVFDAGRMIVNWSDPNNAEMNYLFQSLFVTKRITRQVF